MSIQYRQGDVLLLKVDDLPPQSVKERQPEEADRIVLAYGEVTGHAHSLSTSSAALYRSGDERYVVARQGAMLVHEEHSAIALEPGVYKVIRQREYTPRETRFVAD